MRYTQRLTCIVQGLLERKGVVQFTVLPEEDYGSDG